MVASAALQSLLSMVPYHDGLQCQASRGDLPAHQQPLELGLLDFGNLCLSNEMQPRIRHCNELGSAKVHAEHILFSWG